jgi:hypothetical protein
MQIARSRWRRKRAGQIASGVDACGRGGKIGFGWAMVIGHCIKGIVQKRPYFVNPTSVNPASDPPVIRQ